MERALRLLTPRSALRPPSSATSARSVWVRSVFVVLAALLVFCMKELFTESKLPKILYVYVAFWKWFFFDARALADADATGFRLQRGNSRFFLAVREK